MYLIIKYGKIIKLKIKISKFFIKINSWIMLEEFIKTKIKY